MRKKQDTFRVIAFVIMMTLMVTQVGLTPVYASAPTNATVNFDKNGGSTEASPSAITVSSGGVVTTLPDPPVRDNYTFNNWNTQANGSGTQFTTSTAVSSSITVYAQWLSTNAGLVSVSSKVDTTPEGGDGSTTATAITWTINVARATEGISLGGIVVAETATKKLYSDENFANEITGASIVPLDIGEPKEIFVKATAQDVTTTNYYKIIVTRLPEIIAYYDFDGNFTDEMNGSTLTAFSTTGESISGKTYNNATSTFANNTNLTGDQSYWQWTSNGTQGGGFYIDVNTDIRSAYTIGVRFSFDQAGSNYKKIIDYKNRGNDDTGFYLYNYNLMFYGVGTITYTTTQAIITNGAIADLIVTRSTPSGIFTAYTIVNNSVVQEFKFTDSAISATPYVTSSAVRFGFFHDDTNTSGEATTGGRVYSIKIWDGAIPSFDAANNPMGQVSSVTESATTVSSSPRPKPDVSVAGDGLPNVSITGNQFKGIDVGILVDGAKKVRTAKADIELINDRTKVTVTIDKETALEKLKVAEDSITIPVTGKVDTFIGQLDGEMAKVLEEKAAKIEIRTDNGYYILPAEEIGIEKATALLGDNVKLEDVSVEVTIEQSGDDNARIVANAATSKGFTLVAPPVEFQVAVRYGDKTIEIDQFERFVERTVRIPDGIDPSKITTAVVVEQDGTVRHVPTKVTLVNGKYYATINSLTNSMYSVIENIVEFQDVAAHWSKEAVNDMGSRMIISGVGDNCFEPDRDITRAEFAAILVRSLGVKPGTGDSQFLDVASTAWYAGSIGTAYEYGLISGYGNGKFGPNDKITREQAMTMIGRAMAITELEVQMTEEEKETLLATFIDAVNSAEYAKASIAACVKTGIVTGRNGNVIAPKDNITRAEVAVTVRSLLQKSDLI